MTIRELFQKRYNGMKYGLVAVVFAATVWSTWRHPHMTRLENAEFALLLAIPSVGVVWALAQVLYKCPRCGANLAALSRQELLAHRREQGWHGWLNGDIRQVWERWDACPRCGVSFDEPC